MKTKKSVNWVSILRENQDKVLEKLKEAFEQACVLNNGSTSKLQVWLDKEGNVGIDEHLGNAISYEVWNGDAVYIGSIEHFDPAQEDTCFFEGDVADEDYRQSFIDEHRDEWAIQTMMDFTRQY